MLKLDNNSKKIILISGPTASGKTKIAIKLAKKINGEIVNADSMQVYKEISILSSKPSKSDMKAVKHHLFSFISVKKIFSSGKWLILAKKKIDQILKKGSIPIVVGGTGLYFNSIERGLSKIPKIKKPLSKKIRNLHKKIGQDKFYKRLINLDRLTIGRFLPTDTQRTIRAFEVFMSTKKSIYIWSQNTKSLFKNYDIRKIYINIPRKTLIKNINTRTNCIINKKSISEVKNFLKLKLDKSLPANKIIGIKEIQSFLNKTKKIEDVKELINIKTRQYAKRQKTWSRGYMSEWNMVYSKDLSALLKKILILTS